MSQYYARIIKDSISKGSRLVTMEVKFPRFILAEMNTHRVFSRSSASSRAIPIDKHMKAIRNEGFIPEAFGANKRGMQSTETFEDAQNQKAQKLWEGGMWSAVGTAQALAELGVHKQWGNRVLEPFAWHTAIITSSEWENFFGLRISEHAQPEMRITAEHMKAAMDASKPQELVEGAWHLPYIEEDDLSLGLSQEELVQCSVARCARVSYLNQDGTKDVAKDKELYTRLVEHRHMSPLEHVARVATPHEIFENGLFKWDPVDGLFRAIAIGNFSPPWLQHRKEIKGEDIYRKPE